jgi:hypothetical protein
LNSWRFQDGEDSYYGFLGYDTVNLIRQYISEELAVSIIRAQLTDDDDDDDDEDNDGAGGGGGGGGDDSAFL